MKAEEYYRCAIMLARMYGVAETLEERKFLPTYEFVQMMEQWAIEFIQSEEMDIIHFFEQKLKNEQR